MSRTRRRHRALLERVHVAARLLRHLARLEGVASLTRWTEGVLALAAEAGSCADGWRRVLQPLLDSLVDLLEEMLARLDAGESARELAARPRDRALRAAAAAALLGDAGILESDRGLGRHSPVSRPGATAPAISPPAVPQGSHALRAGAKRRSEGSILMVVENDLRRALLRERLLNAGFVVEEVANAAAAESRLRRAPTPLAVLCDNVEPNCHLEAMSQRTRSDAVAVPLVLVTGARAPAARQRAGWLGALGAWIDPYAVPDLEHLLTGGGVR